ncbi:MAG: hypothetical protein IVW54_09560 [Candidatus Binataceae bacterium]|nr:hypothetical protein [Candidatus Binataceae bacterium]
MALSQRSLAASGNMLVDEARATFTNPSVVPHLVLAGASLIAAVALFLGNKREEAIFVGLWPPTFLALSMLGKIASQPTEQVRSTISSATR